MRGTLKSALISVVAGTACLAIAAPAWAADDPGGANGTVKIDGLEYQLDNRNEPMVTCEFQVEFFDFDENERADIIFAAHPPSAPEQNFVEVGRLDDQLVSDDPATGGSAKQDPDEVFQFTADDLDLSGAKLEAQGYHIKLTIDRKNHPEWTEKHKVFWLEPCAGKPTTPPPTPPTSPPTSPPPTPPGSLPLTGTAVGGLIALGTSLLGGGAALLWLRRRREDTFES